MIKKASFVVTSDEAADDTLGSLMTLENVCTMGHPMPILHSVLVQDASTATPNIDIYLFDANPDSSTAADNAEYPIHANDLTKVIGVVHITTFSRGAIHSIGEATGIGLTIHASAGTGDIYAQAVARGAAPDNWTGTKNVTFEFIN